MKEENEIIKAIVAGEEEKYRLLVDRYQPGLVNHCMAMLSDYEMANDIAQEACVKAYFQLKAFNGNYRFSTWLYKIATNLTLDFLRKKKHISLDDIPEPITHILGPQEQAIQNETIDAVQQAVRKLPIKYQTVISLYYWQERTYEEIADIMNTPLNTIRTWIKRAKELLKEELHGKY